MTSFLTLAAIAAVGLPTLALTTIAQPALAQETGAPPQAEQDWNVLRDPAKKSVIAYIPVTTGLMLAVRCVDGALDGVITGLPQSRPGRATRPLGLSFGDEPMRHVRWNVTTDRTVAISDYPAAFARSLKKGGPLKILIPGGAEDGRNLRHDLVLPGSSSAIEQTLAACNRPLEDPRDALLPDIEDNGLPNGLTWARPPRARYPNTNLASGYVVISCVAQTDGSLAQCQIESEQPPKSRFGAAALLATRDARLNVSDQPGGQLTPRMIAFRSNFYMEGYQPLRGED